MQAAPAPGPDCCSLDEALRRERVAIWRAAITGASKQDTVQNLG
jgi:hypothetical protein